MDMAARHVRGVNRELYNLMDVAERWPKDQPLPRCDASVAEAFRLLASTFKRLEGRMRGGRDR